MVWSPRLERYAIIATDKEFAFFFSDRQYGVIEEGYSPGDSVESHIVKVLTRNRATSVKQFRSYLANERIAPDKRAKRIGKAASSAGEINGKASIEREKSLGIRIPVDGSVRAANQVTVNTRVEMTTPPKRKKDGSYTPAEMESSYIKDLEEPIVRAPGEPKGQVKAWKPWRRGGKPQGLVH